jgi:hypothetical protein
MRYSIPTMFSSILFLPLVLGRELSVIVVTDWKEGQIKTSNPDSPSADISTLHQTVLVGDKDNTQVTKFGYLDLESLEIAPDSFTVWRESGTGNEKFKVSEALFVAG